MKLGGHAAQIKWLTCDRRWPGRVASDLAAAEAPVRLAALSDFKPAAGWRSTPGSLFRSRR